MSRHFLKKRWHSGLFIILLLIVFNYYLSLKFTVIAPGITVDLKDIVTVENGNKDAKGSFFLTTVSSRSLNIPLLLYAAIDPYVNIEPKEEMIPPGWDIKKYIEYTKQWMKESQKIAEVVALRKAGYNPEIRGDGAQVVEIMTDSPARGKLFPGDIIKKVDGRRVNLADEMVKGVTSHKIGETVNLEVERKGRILNITVPTIESKTERGKAVIGVYITTLNWKPVLPVNINIDTGEIGGPSAGSMFALEILNQLLPEDLTKGYKIAGTGTISLDEQIGEIGGVQQKVIAAHRDGAQIFFVPEGNAGDAMLAARGLDIKVVPVRKLDDMLNYLRALK